MKLKHLFMAALCLLGLTLVSCENDGTPTVLSGTCWKGRNLYTDIYVTFTNKECIVVISGYSNGYGTASYSVEGNAVVAKVIKRFADLNIYVEHGAIIPATFSLEEGKLSAMVELYGYQRKIELTQYEGPIPQPSPLDGTLWEGEGDFISVHDKVEIYLKYDTWTIVKWWVYDVDGKYHTFLIDTDLKTISEEGVVYELGTLHSDCYGYYSLINENIAFSHAEPTATEVSPKWQGTINAQKTKMELHNYNYPTKTFTLYRK